MASEGVVQFYDHQAGEGAIYSRDFRDCVRVTESALRAARIGMIFPEQRVAFMAVERSDGILEACRLRLLSP